MPRSRPGAFLASMATDADDGAHDARAMVGVDADHHVLEGGHLAEQTDVLERPRDARARVIALRLNPARSLALERDHPARERVHAGDGVEDGRLARAVRADEPEDLALVDVQGHVAERGDPAEPHGDVR